MVDYILVNNKYRSSVKDVKVIPGEEIVSQHCLLLMDMVLKKKVRRKVNFRPRKQSRNEGNRKKYCEQKMLRE